MALRVTVDRLKNLVDATDALTKQRVMVGVPANKAGRRQTRGQRINNATLAYIHEHGAPAANIPKRAFLRPGVESVQRDLVQIMRKAGDAALNGRPDHVNRWLNAAGLKAQAAVQAKLRSGPFAPLSPRTLAARRARGVSRTKPLIDTAQLLQSISYVVRRR